MKDTTGVNIMKDAKRMMDDTHEMMIQRRIIPVPSTMLAMDIFSAALEYSAYKQTAIVPQNMIHASRRLLQFLTDKQITLCFMDGCILSHRHNVFDESIYSDNRITHIIRIRIQI